MNDIYLVGCCRTAVGAFQGSLGAVKPGDMGALVVSEALRRAGVQPGRVDELMFGCALTAAQGQNVARQVELKAGLPVEIPASTVGMVCGSGMKSVIEAARAVSSGDADIVISGGTENMTMAPYAMPAARGGARMFDTKLVDTMITDGLWDVFNNYHMGETAENICDQWGISRLELDEFALASQKKCAAAQEAERFAAEIVPVPVTIKKKETLFARDEFPRPDTTLEGLAKLRPAFRKDGGRVTAGNSSGINDGAAAIVLASRRAVERDGLKPIAKLVGWGQGGVEPRIMGMGPVAAVRNLTEKTGLPAADFDLVELNEAFAAQSIAVVRELGLDMERVNVNGGAIAIGHPVGASGARIIVTLIHELLRREDAALGLASLCIGGGMGVATAWEKC